jgi:glycosyltransferase involved in cell wall biosynthesis
VPGADRDSGARRLFDFLRFLREAGWAVDFVASNRLGDPRAVRALQKMGIAAHDDGAPRAADHFERLLEAARFDLALFAFWPVAERYLPRTRKYSPRTHVLVDSVDLHFLRDARRVLHAGAGAPALLDLEFAAQMVGELNAYLAADAVLTVSQKEADLLADFAAGAVTAAVVPDCEDLKSSALPLSQRTGVLVLGSFEHTPNVDALEYLCEEILPRVDQRLLVRHPVMVVGNGVNDGIKAIVEGSKNLRLVGWVPAVEPYFHHARISIIPLRYGAGTKRKMIQALMTGTPTVSSIVGTEGLHLKNETHVLEADDPDTFARAIERLLTDDALCRQLASNGLEHIYATHSRNAVQARFLGVIEQTLARAVKPALLPEGDSDQYRNRLKYQDAQRKSPARRQALNGTHSLAASAGSILIREVEVRGTGFPAHTADQGRARKPILPESSSEGDFPARLIAFYLPQYHPIPENDRWWGEGFTDWRNVARAQPLFPGHHQPHLPADLGFYDLRLAETRAEQADLARRHGIHGFCYYHYWFHGKRLLERPFEEVLHSGNPDFPFCLCWANEPWSRRWDGSETDVLQAQSYSAEDDLDHIRWLLQPLSDPRAIQIDGRPVFLIYQANQLPEAARTTDLWRREAERAGLKGLYLLAVETGWDAGWDATQVGFDAKVLFQPQFSLLSTVPRLDVPNPRLRVFDYKKAWRVLANPTPVSYLRYDTVFPSWDNTPRKGEEGWVVHNASPAAYEEWLELAIARALERPPSQRVVFVNAWNEWAEGCHLEPDRRDRLAYLEATRKALVTVSQTFAVAERRSGDRKVPEPVRAE